MKKGDEFQCPDGIPEAHDQYSLWKYLTEGQKWVSSTERKRSETREPCLLTREALRAAPSPRARTRVRSRVPVPGWRWSMKETRAPCWKRRRLVNAAVSGESFNTLEPQFPQTQEI